MKQTITRLASSIIDLAGEVGTTAEAAGSDSIFAAETVILLRDCQRMMNQAREALRLAVANRAEGEKPPDLFRE